MLYLLSQDGSFRINYSNTWYYYDIKLIREQFYGLEILSNYIWLD